MCNHFLNIGICIYRLNLDVFMLIPVDSEYLICESLPNHLNSVKI